MKTASHPVSELFDHPTRFLFFTGKGGVGKTSLACSTAISLADRDRRVLLVSTDPASNLDEVLGVQLGSHAVEVPGVSRLFALNIDPEEAACAYREKIIGPMRGILPEAALRSMEEQLSGACTTEIAAFDEFARLLGDATTTTEYDHVVFDTAPTGHTLRLLTLPKAWTGYFQSNTSGTSCLGPLAGLDQQRSIYEGAVNALADSSRTTLVLVSRPQIPPLREAERTYKELSLLGITNQRLVINGIFQASEPGDGVADALEIRGIQAMSKFSEFLISLPVYCVPLYPNNLLGLAALRRIAGKEPASLGETYVTQQNKPEFQPVESLIEQLALPSRGVIMTMGKGGVGKTTVAAALAVELAARGYLVHLSTTDPAAHLTEALVTKVSGLTVSRIDPIKETESYVQQVLEAQGQGLDADGRALLEEDLRSPCTEEIAVFRAFARTVAEAQDSFVILDTAPTGHTLLLLDATEAYHRELGRQARESIPEEVRELLPRLRDPDYTRVLLITLPEATPVHEAASLQQDLRRAGIEPFAWIVNQSFCCLYTTDPLLQQRAQNELPYLREVSESLATKSCLLRWLSEEPSGASPLRALLYHPATIAY
jgi:arsenite-transporting ATPase